jgi:hypothetical protein
MKKLSLVSLIFFFSFSIQAAEKKPKPPHFLVLSYPPRVDFSVEIPLVSPEMAGDMMRVKAKDLGFADFILQPTPALFQNPAGLEPGKGFSAILPGNANPGKMKLAGVSKEDSPLHFEEMEGGRLALLDGVRPVFVYNYGLQLASGAPEDRRRSTYIHPVYDLRGTVISEDFPLDHFHHRGLSWMWPRVFVAGHEYDLWTIKGIWQHFDKWICRQTGPVCAILGVENSWQLQDRKVMQEYVWIRAFRQMGPGRVLDVRITLQALEPLELVGEKDKGYGGFSLRLPARQGTAVVTPEGLEQEDSNMKKVSWADLSALFAGKSERTGIAIFQHPSHPGHPAGWTLRVKDQYGFLGVAWPGWERVKLEPGKPVTVIYRVWIHDGGILEGKVKEQFAGFSDPPKIRLLPSQ